MVVVWIAFHVTRVITGVGAPHEEHSRLGCFADDLENGERIVDVIGFRTLSGGK